MAITFEQEKKKINWGALVGIVFVVGVLGTAIYYVFFVNPPLIETLSSPRLKTISQISKTNFDFQGALNNPAFNNLKNTAPFTPASQDAIGKANPFLP